MARRGTLDALELRASARIEFLAGGGGLTDPNAPRLVIYVYRPPPPALHSR
jgi:hypothetical protein